MMSFIAPFFAILFAELGDKTQMMVALLAARTPKKTLLFLGSLLAFGVADGFAILMGSQLTRWISLSWLQIISGILFSGFGLKILFEKDSLEQLSIQNSKNIFWHSFTLIFVAELGDKTQMASGVFASQYNPLAVFCGAMAALSLLTLLAIATGEWISKKIPGQQIKRGAAFMFLLFGALFLFNAFWQGRSA